MKDSFTHLNFLHVVAEALDKADPYTLQKLQQEAHVRKLNMELLHSKAMERSNVEIKNTENLQLASLKIFRK